MRLVSIDKKEGNLCFRSADTYCDRGMCPQSGPIVLCERGETCFDMEQTRPGEQVYALRVDLNFLFSY